MSICMRCEDFDGQNEKPLLINRWDDWVVPLFETRITASISHCIIIEKLDKILIFPAFSRKPRAGVCTTHKISDCTCAANLCTDCQYGCDASIVQQSKDPGISVYSIRCMYTLYRTETIAVSESLNPSVNKLSVTLEIISSKSPSWVSANINSVTQFMLALMNLCACIWACITLPRLHL